jgi:hypothetical protein
VIRVLSSLDVGSDCMRILHISNSSNSSFFDFLESLNLRFQEGNDLE